MGEYKNISLMFYMNKLNHLTKKFYEKEFENEFDKLSYLESIETRAKEVIKICEFMKDKLDV